MTIHMTRTMHRPSTFLQPVNGSKSSILNWVMKLSLFMFCFCFCFEKPLKIFLSYSAIFLLFLWFTYLQKRIKESCMYLSSQLLFETLHRIIKSKIKNQKESERVSEIRFPAICVPNFKNSELSKEWKTAVGKSSPAGIYLHKVNW